MDGKKFQEYRKRTGLTQQKLGELLGYSGRNAELMVQHWEHDRAPIPVKLFRPLAEIFGISVEEFLP